MSFPCSSVGKESARNAGDPGSIPGLGRSPGEGNGYPLQYSCLENPTDRGAWRAAAHGVAESRTRLTKQEHNRRDANGPSDAMAGPCASCHPAPVSLQLAKYRCFLLYFLPLVSLTALVLSLSVMSNSLQPHGQWSPPGFSVHGILQAKILEWVAVPFSRGSFQPRDGTQVSCIAGDSLSSEPPGKAFPH